MTPVQAEQELIDKVAEFTYDPLGHALYCYPWGQGELKNHTGPREWQADILNLIGSHLQSEETRYQPLLIAVASGHGIGKSSLISMVLKWGMDTCVDCKVLVTANTEKQLRTKTWPEVNKWHRLAITDHWFEVAATSISPKGKYSKTWRTDAVPWSEHNTEAFQGLHNIGKRIIVIYDEASAIPDKIWEATEGALTDEGTEIIWIAFGNPTRNTGRFRECFRRFHARWKHRHIDSRDVPGTNLKQIEKWQHDYGEDSDFFKIRVRGVFPNQSIKQFIGEIDVDNAFGKILRPEQYQWAPVILSLDPAWGGDDELVIGKRQGLKFDILATAGKNDNDVAVAQMLMRLEDEHQADAVFIDFGFGTGIVSVGQTMGRNWTGVWFSGQSPDPGCLNMRTAMWNSMKQWLKEGGAIPRDDLLRDEILAPEVEPRMDGKLQLESKETMKERGQLSPNRADALALTFAFPVRKSGPLDELGRNKLLVQARLAKEADDYDWRSDL